MRFGIALKPIPAFTAASLLTRVFCKAIGPSIPIGGRGICTTDMRCRRQDLNVGQQSLIRGSSRMTLFRLGLPLSR